VLLQVSQDRKFKVCTTTCKATLTVDISNIFFYLIECTVLIVITHVVMDASRPVVLCLQSDNNL